MSVEKVDALLSLPVMVCFVIEESYLRDLHLPSSHQTSPYFSQTSISEVKYKVGKKLQQCFSFEY